MTVSEFTDSQQGHRLYKTYFENKRFKGKDPPISLEVGSNAKVLVYNNKCLVTPTKDMQLEIVLWYHYYLQHLGENQLEETIVAIMW